MQGRCLLLLMLTVLPGCAEEVSRPQAVALRPITRETRREPAPAAPNTTLDEVYRSARSLLLQGRVEAARAMVQPRVVDPHLLQGAASEENARLLALLGEISAAEKPSTADSLFRAEAYFAWAISADPCMGEYWHEYIRSHTRRLGYANVLAQLQDKEPAIYPAAAIGFSRGSRSLPWTDHWLYLRGLLYATNNDYDEAAKALWTFKKGPGTCPVDQTLGEVFYAMHRYRDAVTLLAPMNESQPGRRSAQRYYMLGLAEKSLGDYAAARKALIESSRLNPTFDEPNRELAAIDWETSGDPAIQSRLFRETLAEHPADWNSWAAFWETRYRSGVAPVEEYRRLAAQTAREHRDASQPLIAEALTRIWESDCAGAATVLAGAPHEAEDSDLALVRFLVAACLFDAAGAETGLDVLEHRDPDLYDTLRRHGARPLVTSLGASGSPEDRTRYLAQFLQELSQDPASGPLTVSFKETYIHGIQKDSAGARAAVDAIATVQTVLGRRQVSIERRLILDEEQLKNLNAGAMALLRRVKAVEQVQIEQGRKLVLTEADIRRLADEVQHVSANVKASEQRLAQKIKTHDQVVCEAVERLAREVVKDQGTMNQLASDMKKSNAVVTSMMQWRDTAPEKVAKDTVTVSGVLSRVASALDLTIKNGEAELSVNWLGAAGLLAELVEAI